MNNEDTLKGEEAVKFLGRFYSWILATCQTRKAIWTLGLLSFTESSIFIIPPEILLLPMCYAKRRSSFYFAFVTTMTSVFGAMAGYAIGALLWDQLGPFLFNYMPGLEQNFDKVGTLYQENAILSLFLAAFTPIPFKVFTLAAGVYHAKISFMTLALMSLVGRGARYFILGGLVYFFGPKARNIIEKNFKKFTIIVALLGILAIVLSKFYKHLV